MMRFLALLAAASCVLSAQALTTHEITEDITFDSLEVAEGGRKLAGAQVDTSLWAEKYTPGQVIAAEDEERAIGLWPTSKGTVPLIRPRVVGPTTPFDGGMKTFKRSNVAFRSGAKMIRSNAVFVVQAGGTLSNVIIAGGGGVFCETHNCALVNVWFRDSIQSALHVNSGTGITTITGGGARNVAHRVVYGQASGTVVISGGFYMENSGRLFESCGTCGPVKRGVIVDGVVSVNPTAELIRVNQNYNDRGTISKASITTADSLPVCTRFNGGATPRKVGNGAFPPVCSYTNAAVTVRSPATQS
ncbi:Polysaccharide lyase [Phytophthora cinnamomi]|uniref:Polysaccharide lyase n=1 Tax=Phytophthora cinnamomi TaxID=4785 RepID=UPI00355A99F5|nr:Polysaccharide lyase [Phytophthora cinnamomi]